MADTRQEWPDEVPEPEVPADPALAPLRFAAYREMFQRHYQEKYAGDGEAFSTFEPAYHYGYTLVVDDQFRNRQWVEMEPEARQLWEEAYEKPWEPFKDAIFHAWKTVRHYVSYE